MKFHERSLLYAVAVSAFWEQLMATDQAPLFPLGVRLFIWAILALFFYALLRVGARIGGKSCG